jgi:pimeloyl-ACP methyl ester carboxylesterase
MPVAAGLYYFAHQADNFTRPPVILIHGAGGHQLFWPPQVRRMHDQRIFAVDLPGHGKSAGLGHHTIEDYCGEILEFLKALKLNAAVLVGHSMGAAIALQMAIQNRKHVLGLGLVGCGARLRVNPALLQGAPDPSTFAETVQLVTDLSFSSETNPRLRELAAQRMAETRPSVLYGDFLACNVFDETDRLSMVSVPTLILCGAEDKMTPARNSEFLHENISDSKMEILPGVGHMLMLERPDRFADLLADFLDSIPYRPGK